MIVNLLPLLILAPTEAVDVVRFEDQNSRWVIVNDGVMGGLSQSQFTFEQGVGVFEGEVSLENNGGFASTRSPIPGTDLSNYSSFVLRVKGDGKRYQLRLRTDRRFDGPAYRATFDTEADRWIDVGLDFSDFEPTWRGRVLKDAGPLDPSQIEQIGFLIADGQSGPFRLEVESIRALKLH